MKSGGCLRKFLLILGLASAGCLRCAAQCQAVAAPGSYDVLDPAPYLIEEKITITNTRGQVIAVYDVKETASGKYQITKNGAPYTNDAKNNPNGLYSEFNAVTFINSLCPGLLTPSQALRPRPEVAAALSAAAVFGQTASDYVFADFNADGVLDNATASAGSVQITLYNQTTGAGTPSRLTIGGTNSTGIIAGDFNGDGKTDLAVTIFSSSTSGNLVVLLGKGDGTFNPPVNYPVGPQPLSLAMVDLNGDGKPDLVVANSNANNTSGTINVLLGKGDGTFASPVGYNAGAIPVSLIATDLNSDGRSDIAFLDARSAPNYDQLLVLLSNGDGTLRAPLTGISTGTNLGQMSYGDLNHDGKLDLLIADQRGSDLTVLMGNGDGTFQPPKAYVNVAQPASIGVAPLADGSTALLSADAIDGSILVTIADSSGAVHSAPIQPLGKSLSAVGAADLNRDGKPDIVITDQGGSRVYVMVNLGNHQFGAATPYSLNGSPSATAIADVNGDGKPDLVVADTNGIDVLPGKGDGTFGPAQSTAVTGASAGIVGPVVADFNGDGKADVVVAVGGQVSFLAGQGNGTFAAGTAAASVAGTVNPVALVTGDFNGDGKPDLAFAYGLTSGTTYSGFLAIELGNGNGTFRSSTISLAAGPVSLALGDVDKDGNVDLIVGLLTSLGPQIAVYLGKGDGAFQNPKAVATAAYLPSITVADFDGDGKPDLLLGDCCGLSEAVLMPGNGDGTFQPGTAFPSGPNPTYLAVADFDSDGKPDLAIGGKNNFGGTLVVLRNTTPSVAKAAVVSTANSSSGAIAPGSLAAAYGTDLANIPAASTSLPLPTSFGGTSVSIRDSAGATTAAPLLFVSAGQVNFLIPSTVATGAAAITITSGDGTQSLAQVTIAPVAPGLFVLNASNLAAAIAVRVAADGSQIVEQVYAVNASGAVVAAPIDLGAATDQVVLEIYGTGIRAAGTSGVKVTIGGIALPVQYAGAQGGFDGLDQINVILPRSLAGKGSVTIQVTANGIAANSANVSIQ
jgi:uncharacterized protein (TIGR03437 family)